MSIQKQFEDDVIDEVLQWSGEKIYCVFGARLENVVADKKAQLRYQLRVIWKNRLCYVFRESALPRHGIKNVPVYLIGWMMDDYFVKIDPCSSAMYPMLWARLPAGFNEWEVLADSLPLHK